MAQVKRPSSRGIDLNLVVLCGRLVTVPDSRTGGNGPDQLRLLIAVRGLDPRRRVDVVPVNLVDPPAALEPEVLIPGTRVWVSGSLRRTFGDDSVPSTRSRLEVHGSRIYLIDDGDQPHPGDRPSQNKR